MIADHNVLFVTLDCCRYDTYQRANTPNIDRLGPMRRAGTMGTYTLPAHTSFFMGYLPFVIESPFEPFYSPDVRQLWRLSSGRKKDPATIGISIEQPTVLRDYSARGFKVAGFGGVRWFRHPALSGLFDEFHLFSENDFNSVFDGRHRHEFPLSRIDDVVSSLAGERFFLFINSAETHVPYDFGDGVLPSAGRRVIEKYRDLWGFKRSKLNNFDFDHSELSFLHGAQVAALEAVDTKLGTLLSKLPRPLLVIITGDHGECFGEDMAWGHGFPHAKVTEVPLLITMLES